MPPGAGRVSRWRRLHQGRSGKMTDMPLSRRNRTAHRARWASRARHAVTLTVALPAAAAIVLAGCSSGSPRSASPGSSATRPARKARPRAAPGRPARCGGAPAPSARCRCSARTCRSRSTTPIPPGGRSRSRCPRSRRRPRPASSRAILLVNPGGPGGPGPGPGRGGGEGLNPAVAAEYNIIGFDPRGVGASVPALSCDPRFFSGVRPNYIPASAAAEQVLIGRAKTYAADCEQRFGWLLPYMTTEDVARDMDSIRVALGQQKISYLRLLLRDLPRRRCTRRCSPSGSAEWCWTAPSTRRASGTPTTSTRTTPSRPGWRRSSPGSPPYHSSYQLGTTAAQVQQAWYTAQEPAAQPSPGRRPDDRRGRVRRHLPDRRLQQRATGPAWLQALSSYLLQHSASALIAQYQRARRAERERVRGLQRRAVQRRELAAQLGEVGHRHQEGLPRPLRSRPGTTPGSTRRARSGR